MKTLFFIEVFILNYSDVIKFFQHFDFSSKNDITEKKVNYNYF